MDAPKFGHITLTCRCRGHRGQVDEGEGGSEDLAYFKKPATYHYSLCAEVSAEERMLSDLLCSSLAEPHACLGIGTNYRAHTSHSRHRELAPPSLLTVYNIQFSERDRIASTYLSKKKVFVKETWAADALESVGDDDEESVLPQSGFEPEACHSSWLFQPEAAAPEATIIPLDH